MSTAIQHHQPLIQHHQPLIQHHQPPSSCKLLHHTLQTCNKAPLSSPHHTPHPWQPATPPPIALRTVLLAQGYLHHQLENWHCTDSRTNQITFRPTKLPAVTHVCCVDTILPNVTKSLNVFHWSKCPSCGKPSPKCCKLPQVNSTKHQPLQMIIQCPTPQNNHFLRNRLNGRCVRLHRCRPIGSNTPHMVTYG